MAINKYINRIAKFGDELVGHSASKARSRATLASEIAARGQTPGQLHRIADRKAVESRNTRVKAVVGTGLTAGAGFLGVHKYHQHRDNAILAKIDSMYVDPNA
jgi:hypothetical protein